jgi:hypothetical protein
MVRIASETGVVAEALMTVGVNISLNCFLSIVGPFEKGKNELAAVRQAHRKQAHENRDVHK